MSHTISKTNLKAIHDVACSAWKTTIEGYANRNVWGDSIELTDSEVDKMFEASSEDQLKVLSKFFKRAESIKSRVKSFEDACKVLKLNPNEVFNKKDTEGEKAFKRLKIIIKALNEGWKPDFSNDNEAKWWNYFYWSGSGFSFYSASYYCNYLPVPSALYLKSKDLALYVKDIAFEDYKTYYLEV